MNARLALAQKLNEIGTMQAVLDSLPGKSDTVRLARDDFCLLMKLAILGIQAIPKRAKIASSPTGRK